MGAHSNTYLGLYLEVENKEETIISTHYVDSNGKTVNSKFNPETGEENREVTKEETEVVYANLYNLKIDGFSEDEFFTPDSGSYNNFTMWIPNKSIFRIAEFDEHDDAKCIELENIDIESLKEKLFIHYNEYLNKLGEEYNYKVKFGLIHYYH